MFRYSERKKEKRFSYGKGLPDCTICPIASMPNISFWRSYNGNKLFNVEDLLSMFPIQKSIFHVSVILWLPYLQSLFLLFLRNFNALLYYGIYLNDTYFFQMLAALRNEYNFFQNQGPFNSEHEVWGFLCAEHGHVFLKSS